MHQHERRSDREYFWIARFRDPDVDTLDYVVDVSDPASKRRSWSVSDSVYVAHRFKTKGDAKQALRSSIWDSFSLDSSYREVIRVVKRVVWEEELVDSDEPPLRQLARQAE